MVSFYNPNKDLRNFLDNLYKHLHSTHAENSNIQFLDCIEKIKIEWQRVEEGKNGDIGGCRIIKKKKIKNNKKERTNKK